MSQPRRSTRNAASSKATSLTAKVTQEPNQTSIRGFCVRPRSALLCRKLKESIPTPIDTENETNTRNRRLTLKPDILDIDAPSPTKIYVGRNSVSLATIKQEPELKLPKTTRAALQQKFKHLLKSAPGNQKIAPQSTLKPEVDEGPVTPREILSSNKNESSDYTLPHLKDLQRGERKILETTKSPKFSHSSIPIIKSSIVPIELRVEIPEKFENLSRIFNALESSVSHTQDSGHLPVFHRLQLTVQGLCSLDFKLNHLSAISAVFPEAYILTPTRVSHRGAMVQSYSIEFNSEWRNSRKRSFECDEPCSAAATKEPKLEISTTPDRHHAAGVNRGNSDYSRVSAIVDVKPRKEEFRRRLIALIDRAHKEFLESENLKLSSSQTQTATPTSTPRAAGLDIKSNRKDKSDRWHPDFEPQNVPIPEAELPSFPTGEKSPQGEDLCLKVQLLSKRHSISSSSSTVCGSLDSPMMLTKSPSLSPSNNNAKSPGRFSDILLRIREKERKRQEYEKNSLSIDDKNRLTMLSRLPLIAETVKSTIIHNGRSSLPLQKIAQSVTDSYPIPLGIDEALRHLRLLSEIASNFCCIIDVGAAKYVRLTQNATLEDVTKAVHAAKRLIEKPNLTLVNE